MATIQQIIVIDDRKTSNHWVGVWTDLSESEIRSIGGVVNFCRVKSEDAKREFQYDPRYDIADICQELIEMAEKKAAGIKV